MQHEGGIENRLHRSGAAGAVEHLLGNHVGMTAAGDVDKAALCQQIGDPTLCQCQLVALRRNQLLQHGGYAVAILVSQRHPVIDAHSVISAIYS